MERRKDGRFVTTSGTGRNRKWFFSRISYADAVQQKEAYLAGTLPLRPGCIAQFVDEVWWPRLQKTTTLSTRKRYRQAVLGYITPKIGSLLFREVTLPTLLQIFESVDGENYRMIHSRLQSIFKLAHAIGHLEHNIALLVPNVPRPVKRKVDYTLDKARQIEEAFKGSEMECPVWLGLRFGVRRGEALGIKPSRDFDHARKVLVLRGQVTKEGEQDRLKGKREGDCREIPMSAAMWARLVSYVQPDSIYLVPMTPNRLSKRFDAMARKKGWELSFHDLRSFANANMHRESGADALTIRSVIGHGSETVNARYFDENLEAKRGAVERLDKAYSNAAQTSTNVVEADD